jgi:hypothetical protein
MNPHFSQSNWNARIETVVRDIQDQSKLYKEIHLKKAHSLTSTYNHYMMCTTFLSPLATALSGIGIIIFPEESYYLTISTALLTFLSGVMISYVKFNKMEELSQSHSIAASKYTSLEKNIHRQLSLYESDRISSQEYLEWLTSTFDELLISSPLIETDTKLIQDDNG